jgi:hypothetical protein
MRKAGGSTVRVFLEKVYMMKRVVASTNNETIAPIQGLKSQQQQQQQQQQQIFSVKGDTRSWSKENDISQLHLLKGVTLRHQEFNLFPLKCLVTTPTTV